MSASDHDLPRGDQLACDAALFGLDEAELAELAGLGADALLDLELAAGEIAARTYEAGDAERLPAALAERVLADLGRVTPESPARGVADRRSPEAADRHSPAAADRHAPARLEQEAEPAAARVIPLDRGGRRVRAAAPWLLAAAAIALLILGRVLPGDPVAGPGPGPAPTADAGVEVTPASAREALLAITGTAQLAWKVTEDPSATGASGDVVWHNGVQRGYMRFRGLAANDPGKVQYQLWIFDGERDDRYPVDGGVFNVGPDGEVVVPIEAKLHVNRPTLFAITVEKPGGVVVSKRERIVLTAAPPPT